MCREGEAASEKFFSLSATRCAVHSQPIKGPQEKVWVAKDEILKIKKSFFFQQMERVRKRESEAYKEAHHSDMATAWSFPSSSPTKRDVSFERIVCKHRESFRRLRIRWKFRPRDSSRGALEVRETFHLAHTKRIFPHTIFAENFVRNWANVKGERPVFPSGPRARLSSGEVSFVRGVQKYFGQIQESRVRAERPESDQRSFFIRQSHFLRFSPSLNVSQQQNCSRVYTRREEKKKKKGSEKGKVVWR